MIGLNFRHTGGCKDRPESGRLKLATEETVQGEYQLFTNRYIFSLFTDIKDIFPEYCVSLPYQVRGALYAHKKSHLTLKNP